MPNLPCTSYFTMLPLRSSIYLTIRDVSRCRPVRLVSGRSILNERRAKVYLSENTMLKGTRKGLAGSPRAKPSACVLFLSEWQRGHFHGMSWGAWVYPAKPLLPQGLWALWSLCPSCIHPVLYSLPQISLSTPLAALTQLSVFIQPHPPLRQPNKAPLVRPSLLLARHSRDSQHWREWVKRTHAVHSHLIACCFLSIKL